jgi:antitoxin ParD1/3/4
VIYRQYGRGLELANFANRCVALEIAAMSTMNISLPEAMKRWVERQARSGRFGNSSDYVRELIRRDQERQAKIAHMQALVDEGIASGKGSRTMKDIKDLARRKAGA